MPKSRRNKLVTLARATKKGRATKEKLVESIRACLDAYERVFVFRVHNQRNTALKDLRVDLKPMSRFFFGKNKVMAVALGRSVEDEARPNLAQLSNHLVGDCGLLFTNSSEEDTLTYFRDYEVKDYARSGAEATERVMVPKGPIPQFAHSMEPYVRKLGLPTVLREGSVMMLDDFVVCERGEQLTPEKARLLKLLDIKLAQFRLELVCHWSADTFKEY